MPGLRLLDSSTPVDYSWESSLPASVQEGKEERNKMEKRCDEQVVQRFRHRCPYCDQPITYEHLDLKTGENPIRCPSCHRTFIKVVSDSDEGGRHP